MIEGVLTPGMPYNDFYYLVHILLIKVYSYFFTSFPEIPWLSVFQYSYLLVSLFIILNIFSKYVLKFKNYLAVVILLIIFYSEQATTLICTNIGFLMSFSALFALAYEFRHNKLTYKSRLFYNLFYVAGLFTRPEAAVLMLFIVGLYYFLILDQNKLITKFTNSIKLYLIPAIISVTVIIWFAHDISTSDAFYKKIEPDVEYELTTRNNIVSVNKMNSYIDTMRYKAINKNMWGDATTNDAEFLRSLIDKEMETRDYQYMMMNTWTLFFNALLASKFLFLFNILIILFITLAGYVKKNKETLKMLLYHIIIWMFFLFIGYKVKMTDTGMSVLLCSINILYVSFLFIVIDIKNNALQNIFLMLSLVFFLGHGTNLWFKSRSLNKFYIEQKNLKSEFDEIIQGKNIFLNSQSASMILNAFKPFESYKFNNYQSVVLFDIQHISTVEPYRSYLQAYCNCDPNHYGEFFKFVRKGGEENIFLMSASYKDFLTEYLNVVHKIDIQWKLLYPANPDEKEAVRAYTIKQS
ncbi:MAG: hypothetical protein WD048_01880 [Chitinophagales bacterium]